MTEKPQSIGRVITPNDPGYDQARGIWNARFDHRPEQIVYCQDAQQVSAALLQTLDRRQPFRVRGAGHSYEGFSVGDGGVVIDVSDLNTISVNQDRTVAVIGSGAQLGDVYAKLGQMGATIPAGTCPSVGIAGLALGGGIGMLIRSLGLLADSLLRVEMVDARGRILTADARSNPDLFWACRGGGGGNFGIVTSLTFRLAPISKVTIFNINWQSTDLAVVLNAWQRWAPDADERITSSFVMPPKSVDTVVAFGQFLGTVEELLPLLEPLARAGHPVQLSIVTMPYSQAVDTIAAFEGPGTAATSIRGKSTMTFAARAFNEQAIRTLEEKFAEAPSGSAPAITFFALGGAMRRVASHETPFPHRTARVGISFQAMWESPDDDQTNVAWVEDFLRVMRPYTTGGAYVNNPERSLKDWPWAYYGNNFPRLMSVKSRYDPENVFNHPQSIPVSLMLDEAHSLNLPESMIVTVVNPRGA